MSALVIASLSALGFTGVTASAAPVATDLIISEYVEGSGVNKAIELYNGTDSDIELGDYSVEVYSNGGTSTSADIPLIGTVAAGETFVLATNALVAFADQTTGSGLWNGDDAIVLQGPDGVVDSFGQVGFDPGSQWSQGAVGTLNHTLRRSADVCAGDTDPSDDFNPSLEWTQFDQDTFDGLGSHSTVCTPGGGDGVVAINEFSADTTGPDVEYIEVLGDPDTDYSDFAVVAIDGDGASPSVGSIIHVSQLGTTGAGGFWLHELAPDTLPDGSMTLLLVSGYVDQVIVDSEADGTLDDDAGLTVIDAVAVQDEDAGDLAYAGTVLTGGYDGNNTTPGGASRIPDGAVTDTVADWVRNDFDLAGIPGQPGSLTVGEALNTPGAPNSLGDPDAGPCGDPSTAIGSVQGDGFTSPLLGERVVIEGIVVGDFQAGGFDGVYLQDQGDSNADTSDGIFVLAPDAAELNSGNLVRVIGSVEESSGMTRLAQAEVGVCNEDQTLPPVVQLQLPASDAEREALEGMRVTLAQSLAILEYFNYGRFGEIALGVDRQFQPTAVFEPGSAEATQLLADHEAERIILDDGRGESNPDPARHPNGADFALDNI
ncbi:MAG: lamin tail domain-containing protein, partial [Ornithinimicrobium sp.]